MSRTASQSEGAAGRARRVRGRRGPALDACDLGIIARMEHDARCGVGEVAEALGVHRNTVTAKLNRLIRAHIIRPAVYVDPRMLGYRAPAIIGIKVVPGEIERVATQVASLPNIHHVHVCLGRYDIILAGSLFRDEDELLSFVTNEIGRAPGVTGVETMITVGLGKVSFAAVDAALSDGPWRAREREAIAASLDQADYAIIMELQRDARQPVFALAAALGMNRNTVASKLRRLLDEGIVRAVAFVDPAMMGFQVVAAIGLSVLPGQIETVSARLNEMRSLQGVILCIGRYNIMAWCVCRDQEELYKTITEGLADIPGLRDAEAMLVLRTKKASLDYLQPALRAG